MRKKDGRLEEISSTLTEGAQIFKKAEESIDELTTIYGLHLRKENKKMPKALRKLRDSWYNMNIYFEEHGSTMFYQTMRNQVLGAAKKVLSPEEYCTVYGNAKQSRKGIGFK
ncbi:MAG: hypothetical protein WCK90_02000 [archaeon]